MVPTRVDRITANKSFLHDNHGHNSSGSSTNGSTCSLTQLESNDTISSATKDTSGEVPFVGVADIVNSRKQRSLNILGLAASEQSVCVSRIQSLFRGILNKGLPAVVPGTAFPYIEVATSIEARGRVATVYILNTNTFVEVLHDCVTFSCSCTHSVGNVKAQLKPCAVASEFVRDMSQMSAADVYVLLGVCFGFPIVDDVPIASYSGSNYRSILVDVSAASMSRLIRAELAEGKITRVDKPPHCIHSLGAVRKDDSSIRPITDCRRPLGLSINTKMSDVCSTFSYRNLDNVVEFTTPFCVFAVIDISHAYRSVNVFPAHAKYQGFAWDLGSGNEFYTDHCLCFGLRCAPFVFTQIGDFIVRCMARLGVQKVVNYIDDFIICECTFDSCLLGQQTLIRLVRGLGFAVNEKKVIRPAHRVRYLGIDVDSTTMTLTLPEDKLIKLKGVLCAFRSKRRASKLDLQKLAGILAHCATIIRAGRTFSRRVINLCNSIAERYDTTKLSAEFHADLDWWLSFAELFNGVGKAIRVSDTDVFVYTDASGSGFGGYLTHGGDYFWGVWSPPGMSSPCHLEAGPDFDDVSSSINAKELWPVLVACKRWGITWHGKHVKFLTDNTTVCAILRSGRSRSVITMDMLREIFWISFIHSFVISVDFVKGLDNTRADYLSRLTRLPINVLVNNVLYETLCFSCSWRLASLRAEGPGPAIQVFS